MHAGELVGRARGSSSLSIRDLGARAGVAGSTITRIQSAAVDPSVGTLERLLAAAGFELQLSAIRRRSERRSQLGDLADAWELRRGRVHLAWPRWRALIDALTLHPELVAEAISCPPPPAGSPVVDALLAAVAEKLADDVGLSRPGWVDDAPRLDEPYQPPVTRTITGRSVPAQLVARGLIIDTDSLWRGREGIGA